MGNVSDHPTEPRHSPSAHSPQSQARAFGLNLFLAPAVMDFPFGCLVRGGTIERNSPSGPPRPPSLLVAQPLLCVTPGLRFCQRAMFLHTVTPTCYCLGNRGCSQTLSSPLTPFFHAAITRFSCCQRLFCRQIDIECKCDGRWG